jgi:hypothetical protein
LTVTVYVPSAAEVLAETLNSEVAEPLVTVAEGGFSQDGAGWVTPETVQLKSTWPVKPLNAMTVMVEVATSVSMKVGARGDRVML